MKTGRHEGGPLCLLQGRDLESAFGQLLRLKPEDHHPATAARLHVGSIVDVLRIHGSADDFMHVVQMGNRVIIES